MAKVCRKVDFAAPFHGFQLEGSIAPACPNVEELRDGRGDACHICHPCWPLGPGQQTFCCPQPDWRAGLCNLS